MRLGILGGTFDPIHRGHLAMARHALKQFKLDKILFIPAARPPHKKKGRSLTSVKHRLAMVRLAVGRSARFEISKLEIERKGPSYTVDTLKALRAKYPSAKLYLILGQDSCENLNSWKDPAAIKRLARFLVAKRPGSRARKKSGSRTSWIRMPACAVSSSGVRNAIKRGLELDDYLLPAVIRYLKIHRLYGYRS